MKCTMKLSRDLLQEETRGYHIVRSMFSSRSLSRKTKTKYHVAYIHDAMYACATWSTTRSDELLIIFNKKILW